MCPDRQIISLYIDGELPSPWKEKLEAHMETCNVCCETVDRYARLGKHQDNPAEDQILAARERVWNKLSSPALVKPYNQMPAVLKPAIWRQSIAIPLPAAAAAAIIIIAMAAVFVLRDGGKFIPQETMALIPENMQILGNEQSTVPVNDMAGVLQYLSNMNDGDFMVIRLPETKSFVRMGEPKLINASDYSRRSASR